MCKTYWKYPDCNYMALLFIAVNATNEKALVSILWAFMSCWHPGLILLTFSVSHGATYCLFWVCSWCLRCEVDPYCSALGCSHFLPPGDRLGCIIPSSSTVGPYLGHFYHEALECLVDGKSPFLLVWMAGQWVEAHLIVQQCAEHLSSLSSLWAPGITCSCSDQFAFSMDRFHNSDTWRL